MKKPASFEVSFKGEERRQIDGRADEEKEVAQQIQSSCSNIINPNDVKFVYNPLAQSDAATSFALFPNATKVVLTGIEGVGPLFFEENFKEEILGNAMGIGLTKFASDDFFDEVREDLDDFIGGKYPTMLLIAGQIFNKYGVEDFTITQTKHGYAVHFELNGIQREVEYIDFELRKTEEIHEEEADKKLYLQKLECDAIIYKALPFTKELIRSSFPSALPILCASLKDGGVVVSDLSYESSPMQMSEAKVSDCEPVGVFKGNSSYLEKDLGKLQFGYGNKVFIAPASELLMYDGKIKPSSLTKPVESRKGDNTLQIRGFG